jgi:hypothetical protein
LTGCVVASPCQKTSAYCQLLPVARPVFSSIDWPVEAQSVVENPTSVERAHDLRTSALGHKQSPELYHLSGCFRVLTGHSRPFFQVGNFECLLSPKADVQLKEIGRLRPSANGRGCVKTPQQSHPGSRLQTQRETLLTGLRADSVLLVSN